MSILPSETLTVAVVAHFGLTLPKVLPFARGYAAALGIAPEQLTVAHFFRYVRREGFEMVDPLVALRYFKRRLRAEVFGPHDVYVHYLRRICVAVLRNGYGLDFTTIAAILGHTEDTARRVYYLLTPSAAAMRYAAALSGEAPRDPGVDAVMGELKRWLDHVARDLGR